ncbi:hypothetical protein GC088_06225 [Arthrobacter sp. JZ12]|uniref:DUF6318 family protein n=1 Tax=Arthrobacter sp. JZ12 TaxID=2654190 RepID=UPI002B49792E|nr:DUF6318 family protein [Arthrobacter sp. JZ12]WRH24704.1 hypothetical protein GC088_06225 [Arthrobacter sp. JZ12]
MAQSRRAHILLGASISVLLLTGCQGGDPSAVQTPVESASASSSASASASPTADPTPTPSPASAEGPAVNLPVPEKPALADENSVEGLEAFTKWWFELLNYAYATNDLGPLKAVTDEGCTTCQNIEESIAQVYADGGWMSGGDVSLDSFNTDFRPIEGGAIDAFVGNTQAATTVYDSAGSTIGQFPEQRYEAASLFRAIYVENAWLVVDYGFSSSGE